ncbi:hypothetical protein D043_3707A, partial [Vibrio parahaemolyticus EKP-021]
MEINCIL